MQKEGGFYLAKSKHLDLCRDKPKYPTKKLKMTLGLPTSINHMYINTPGGGKRLNSTAEKYVRDARAQINLAMKEQGWRKSFDNTWYYLDMVVYMPDLRKRDSHNMLKLLLDTLEGFAFHDDYFIMPQIHSVEYDKENPRIEVVIRPQTENERRKALKKVAEA